MFNPIYSCVPVRIPISPLLTLVQLCLQLFTSACLPTFTHVYSCLPSLLMFTSVFSCSPMLSRVYLCLLLFTCPCLPMFTLFTRVYSCLPMFNPVYSHLPMFTLVHLCLLLFTRACLPMFTTVYSCMFNIFNEYMAELL